MHGTVSCPVVHQSLLLIDSRSTNLESLPSIGIKGSIVIENVDEGKVMTDSNFIIVSVMRRSNLNSSCTEFHVDDDRVRDNRESAIYERVDSEFSVKMLQSFKRTTPKGIHVHLLCT